MGKVDWPLKDLRRDSFGNWHLKEITNEAFTVPSAPDSAGFYKVPLVEVPAPALLDGSNDAPVVECPIGTVLSLVTSQPSGANQVFVDYDAGKLIFHSSKAGVGGQVTYWGKGSLVEAAELNDLHYRVEALETGVLGEQGVTGVKGGTGSKGCTGTQGETGSIGPIGLRGSTGLQGTTGSKGPEGQRGHTGFGLPGGAGPRGYTGPKGPEGVTGLRGATGLPGATGQMGATGVAPSLTGRYESPVFNSKIWTVEHDLGDKPVVQVYGTDDKDLDPTEILNGETVTFVSFSSITNGYAICVLGGERGLVGHTGTIGIQGSTGVSTPPVARYEASFSPPAQIWVVNHNLGYEPLIQVYDGSWVGLTPTGVQNGANTSTVFFDSPQTGFAIALAGGLVGNTGLSGATGRAGATGPFGHTGPRGPTGVGATGLIGPQGVTGPLGDTGPVGSTGLLGPTGQMGATGLIGRTGLTGETGSRGPTGLGPLGATGLRGPTGFMGETGRQGDTGYGIPGSTGLTGVTGEMGPRGYTGPIPNLLAITMTMVGETALLAGVAGDMRVLNDCLLQKASLLAGQTGSIEIDLWKSGFADFPPMPVDSITLGNHLKITDGIKMQDSALVGWTGALSAGDVIRVNIVSATAIQRCLLTLEAESN